MQASVGLVGQSGRRCVTGGGICKHEIEDAKGFIAHPSDRRRLTKGHGEATASLRFLVGRVDPSLNQ